MQSRRQLEKFIRMLLAKCRRDVSHLDQAFVNIVILSSPNYLLHRLMATPKKLQQVAPVNSSLNVQFIFNILPDVYGRLFSFALPNSFH